MDTNETTTNTTGETLPIAPQKVCTVPEIVELFENVDLKIQALHQCSADDFLGLNAKFKVFYKESKNVSKDASALLELFSRDKNEQLKDDLDHCRTELQQSLLALKEQQSETLRIVRELNDSLEEYLYPLRHINNEFAIRVDSRVSCTSGKTSWLISSKQRSSPKSSYKSSVIPSITLSSLEEGGFVA